MNTVSFASWLRDFSKKQQIIALLLSALTFALFSPAIGYDFINYDDNLYVFQNPHVARGFCLDSLWYAFRTIDGANWMPMTWLSYFLDTSIFGNGPAGYHFINIVLHSASVGLLFLILRRLKLNVWVSLTIAAIFAFHPQRLESVAWIAERKDVLSVFFWMLGLFAYVRYVEQPKIRRLIWVVAFFVFGLMSKPMDISFPFVLLVLDFWPLRRFENPATSFWNNAWLLVREKIPLFVLTIAISAVTYWSQCVTHSMTHYHFPWYLKLFRSVENLWYYFQTFFAPTGLAIVQRIQPLNYIHVALSILILGTITILTVYRVRRRPEMAVGWFWFLLTVAPVVVVRLGPVTVADRYNYLPSVGLSLITVCLAARIISRCPRSRSVLIGGFGAWIFYCTMATWTALPQWQNTFTVFENAYRNGANYIACDQVASLLYERHEYQQSIAACNRGLEQNSTFASLYNTRGGDFYMLGDLDKALDDFNRAIEINSNSPAPYYGRALVELRRKQFPQATADFKSYTDHNGNREKNTFQIPSP